MKTSLEEPKPKNKGGRPRAYSNSRPMKITISEDDYNLLKILCSYTGSRPASVMRELLEESRPVIKAMIEALESAKNNTSPPSDTLASRLLSSALKNKEPTQQDLLDLMSIKDGQK
ncbi:MAG: hypothetical protein Q9M50_15310 [Methylococcales bacterium]|nr:hypothetical protein [Methylococcales bacterium]MDQ7091977.1 hypothetical protein [Methylococcales bacterium]